LAWDSIKTNSAPDNVIAAEEWNDMTLFARTHLHDGIGSRGIKLPSIPDPSPEEGMIDYDAVNKLLVLFTGIRENLLKEGQIFLNGRRSGRWYTSSIESTAETTGSVTLNTLRALPFRVANTRSLDKIAINVTTSSTGIARLGIYSDSGCYPDKLLCDSGEISYTLTGKKEADIDITLNPGFYWLVHNASVTSTLRCMQLATCLPVLGYDDTLGTAGGVGWSYAQSFGELPDPFPEGAAVITTVPIPAIFVRIV
jgi:hypothetical protein